MIICSEIDECATGRHNCHHFAECTNTQDGYKCACKEGFLGDGRHCYDLDECDLDTAECDSLAICINTPGSYECTCPRGYEGDGSICAVEDECYLGLHTCHENAACTNTDEGHGFGCDCLNGYTGDGLICEDVMSVQTTLMIVTLMPFVQIDREVTIATAISGMMATAGTVQKSTNVPKELTIAIRMLHV